MLILRLAAKYSIARSEWGPKFVQQFQDIFSKIIIAKPYSLNHEMTCYFLKIQETCAGDISILTKVISQIYVCTCESGQGRIADLGEKNPTDSP